MKNIEEKLANLPPELLPYKDNILATVKPVIEIVLSKSNDINLFSSKFGGKPYLPKAMDYPHKSDGTPLTLLAQINLAEVPPNDQLPKQGMLSFFIAGDDLYGLDLDNMTHQDGFRVLYFEQIIDDTSQLWQDFTDIDKQIAENPEYYLPFDYGLELAMNFTLNEQAISGSDKDFDSLFDGKDLQTDVLHDDIDLFDEVVTDGIFAGDGHKLLGYPVFTQDDPRYDEFKAYILLLQIDTDNTNGYEIMWGDSGVGNFFIHPNDLKNRDFSNIMYNYDCY